MIGTTPIGALPADTLLSITRDARGLSVSAKIYDKEGVKLAYVDDNHPHAVGNVCARRPDVSTFVVEDFHGNELLFVRYLNPLAIEVRGIFAYPGHPWIQISKTTLKSSIGPRMSDSCMMVMPGSTIYELE